MDSKAALALCMWHEECLTSLEKQLAASRAGETAAKAKVAELQLRDSQQQEHCKQLEHKVQQLTAELQISQSELASVLSQQSLKDVGPPRHARVIGMTSGCSCGQTEAAANALKDFSRVTWNGDAPKAGSFSMCLKGFAGEKVVHVPSSDLMYDMQTASDYMDSQVEVISKDMEADAIIHLRQKLGNNWTAHLGQHIMLAAADQLTSKPDAVVWLLDDDHERQGYAAWVCLAEFKAFPEANWIIINKAGQVVPVPELQQNYEWFILSPAELGWSVASLSSQHEAKPHCSNCGRNRLGQCAHTWPLPFPTGVGALGTLTESPFHQVSDADNVPLKALAQDKDANCVMNGNEFESCHLLRSRRHYCSGPSLAVSSTPKEFAASRRRSSKAVTWSQKEHVVPLWWNTPEFRESCLQFACA